MTQGQGGVYPTPDLPVRWVYPKHVWVNTGGGVAMSRPGILLAWRQVPDGNGPRWEAYVVEASTHRGLGSRLQVDVSQGWHASHHVKPVDGQAG